jgi:hypothetical protein
MERQGLTLSLLLLQETEERIVRGCVKGAAMLLRQIGYYVDGENIPGWCGRTEQAAMSRSDLT